MKLDSQNPKEWYVINRALLVYPVPNVSEVMVSLKQDGVSNVVFLVQVPTLFRIQGSYNPLWRVYRMHPQTVPSGQYSSKISLRSTAYAKIGNMPCVSRHQFVATSVVRFRFQCILSYM